MNLFVGIGAGLVAALLFSVVITGSPLSVLLYSAAPLPVFIATLGWQHRSGLLATLAGALAVGLALSWPAALAFAVIIALPAWWIAYLAQLGRAGQDGMMEWYPLGNLLGWIAATAALVTLGSALVMTTDYDSYRTVLARMIERLLAEMQRGRLLALPAGTDLGEIAQQLAPAIPVGIGASFVLTLVVNLWVAAKAVAISSRLTRPWPFIPSTAIPRRALLLLVGGAAAALIGGFVGIGGAALAGAMLSALMLSGLAMVHDLSRGRLWRMPLLISVYIALLLMQAVLTPFLIIAGLVDSLLGLRRRFAPPPTRP